MPNDDTGRSSRVEARGPMEVEEELEARILALRDREPGLEEVHAFLLEAAELLGGPPDRVVGPWVRFQWRAGDRLIELSPEAPSRPEGGHRVRMRAGDLDTIEGEWRLTFKNAGTIGELPYFWHRSIADEASWAPDGWAPVAMTWAEFDDAFPLLIEELADDVALTPPDWRGQTPVIAWQLGEGAPWREVAFSAEDSGLSITAQGGYGSAHTHLPRDRRPRAGHHISPVLTSFLAGLARGGAPARLTDLRLCEVRGLHLQVLTPGRIHEYGLTVDIPVEEGAQDEPMTGCSWDDFVRAALEDRPAITRPRRAPVPLDVRLSPEAAADLVSRLLRALEDSASPAPLLTELGAVEGRARGPVGGEDPLWTAPQGWSVRVIPERIHGAFRDRAPWRADLDPCAPPRGVLIDLRQANDYVRALSGLLEQRYGSPFIRRADGDGLTRVFRSGDHAVIVDSGLGVRATVSDLGFALATAV